MKSNFTILFATFLLTFSFSAIKGQSKMDSSINYIHSEKVSFSAQMMKGMFSLLGLKKGRKVIKKVTHPTTSEAPTPIPKSMLKKYEVQESTIQNRKVWTIKPKENASDKVMLYLHGGVYVYTIKKYHWKFVEELLLRTKANIVIPDYPLAPDSNGEMAIDFVGQVYKDLLLKHPSEKIVLAGDSAGAGLALGFAMHLNKEHEAQPSQIILLSPWLDISMSNEAILAIDKKDKILGIKPLQIAGKAFAGNLDWKDYRVSPIYGDFSGLGQISVFIGTHDLFVADCRKLKRLTEASNISINYFEYPKMFHGWYIAGYLKESKVALDQIGSLITNG